VLPQAFLFLKSICRRLPLAAALLLWAGLPAGARAEVIPGHAACHAATRELADADASAPSFSCKGAPTGYQTGTLWLRYAIARFPGVNPADLVVLVHNSRFDRVEASFLYADGHIVAQQVRGGAFTSHWRAGGQIAFEAPQRDVALRTVTMRFDRPASANLLRIRMLDREEAARQATALAASVAAALTLLAIGVIYNVSLAVALRRQFQAWQASWGGCMLVWGATWSQLHLFLFPGMAGAPSAQLCTGLACLAVTLAAFSAVSAIKRPILPTALRMMTLVLALAVGVIGIPLTFMRQGPIDAMASIIGFMIVAVLVCVAVCIGIAWRKGSSEARTFAGGWSLPMATLAAIQFLDTDSLFWGGGSQLAILFASAWYTLWMAVVASRTHARLQVDHDRARRAEAHARELARRDPLTGLRNRRGFVQAVAPLLELARNGTDPIALMVIDVDLFKHINDTHGHDAGDMVLVTIARRIERWEGAMCTVARMGGEEFALMIGGMEGFALTRFAESIRLGIGACDHSEAMGPGKVTVSIGVAQAGRQSDFRQLYRLADQALYSAKRQGRDRVVIHDREDAIWGSDRRDPASAA
jgi:diguanylate cyclase (GGDEF)-like protein